jgi:uncharacterized membrane protein
MWKMCKSPVFWAKTSAYCSNLENLRNYFHIHFGIFTLQAKQKRSYFLEKSHSAIHCSDRIGLMDDLRGLAIFCMIFYHTFFLLGSVIGSNWGDWLFDVFAPMQPLFAGIFIVISGICGNYSHSNAKRGFKLLCIALAISAITCFILPEIGLNGLEVRFGILHLLSCSMLLFSVLRKPLAKLSPVWGAALFFLLYIVTSRLQYREIGVPYLQFFGQPLSLTMPDTLYQSQWLFPFGLRRDDFSSADYFPLLPYCFMFLAGTYIGKLPAPDWAKLARVRPLAFLGRHSLIIYIAHQPLILGLLALANQFSKLIIK